MTNGPEIQPPAGPAEPLQARGPDAPPPGGSTPPEDEPETLEAERIPHRAPDHAPRAAAVRTAWAVAIAADAIQFVLWPMFAPGVVSPFDDVVDVVVAAILIRLLGWHWAFLPAFVTELIPGVDLVPTWTLATLLATRGGASRRRGA